jgi:hypothetical protein
MTKIEKFLEENPDYKTIKQSGSIEYKILNYLKDIENGFFVEAGAFDGIFQSNTKILEDLGWRGLLVEPSYDRSIECYNNRSKESSVFNGALVSFDYNDETITGDFGSPVSSISDIGMPSKLVDITIKINTKIGPDGKIFGSVNTEQIAHALRLQGFDINRKSIKIKEGTPARTLTYLLNELNVNHVDLFSLDTEGYELEALKGVDFDKITFSYLLIEVNSDIYSLEELDSFLLEKGYVNILNISNFTREENIGWPGTHQDYLYKNKNLL